ncbi:MAG: indole-3-glycerol-phosphate synthase TrpC, partial [Bacteroidales bacterium]|nr:indole-3-glycerol-phosphate synthase TrpC [Bacteroidales bacterium]
MKDILQEIVAHKRQEVAEAAARVPAVRMMREVEAMEETERTQNIFRPSMRRALEDSATGIIAEFKRKSPSKGWIREAGRPDVIPPAYQRNGAAA